MTRMKSGRLVWGLLGALLLAAALWWGLAGSGPVRAKEVRPPVEPTVQPAVDWEAIARRYGVSGEFGLQRSLNVDSGYDWHTFYPFGGLNITFMADGMAVDADGNIYLASNASSAWTENGAEPLHPYTGANDIAIIKLNSAGAYQWHTFYGGAGRDKAHALTVDTDGNLYVTGFSESSWNGVSDTAPLHAYGGGTDLFVLKLNSAGDYQWHTFYGGTGYETPSKIVLSGSDDLVVVGSSGAWTGDGNVPPLHSSGSGLILKLTRSGEYLWHTVYGFYVYSVAVAGNGDIYGYMDGCNWLGDNNTAPLHPCSGSGDMAVLKLNGDGAYQWHTFYGSPGYELRFSLGQITLDQNDGVYLTSMSDYTWLGDGGAAPLHPFSGDGNLVVLKLNSAGIYQWHTFYGWISGGAALAVDGDGGIYITGINIGFWQGEGNADPVWNGSPSSSVLLKLNNQGRYCWHLFYGGDFPQTLIVRDQSLYLAGLSRVTSPWVGPEGIAPIHPVEPVTTCGGTCYNLFVMKLRNLPRATTGIAFSPIHPQPGETVTVTAWVTGETGMPTGTVTFTLAGFSPMTGTLDAQGVVTYVTPGLAAGNYTVTAEYGGYEGLLGSSASKVMQVGRSSAVELTISPTIAVPGQQVVYRVKVTDLAVPTRTLTGTVRLAESYAWRNGINLLLDSNGYAVYTVTAADRNGSYASWGLGPQMITATYLGNEEYHPTDAGAMWTLNRATSVISLAIRPVTLEVGGWATYSVTIGTVEPGAYIPSGLVTFTIGSHEPVTRFYSYLNSPVIYDFQVTQAGLLPVKAEVAADYWYAGSQAVLTQTVLKAATALTVTGPTTVTAGQPAVLTARVQPTATGVVSWSVPGRPAVTGTLDANSVATGTLVLPAAGHYSVTVTYGGDAIYAGSAAQHELAVWARLYLPLVLKTGQQEMKR